MRMLGDANWWAPAPLRRFYARHGIHEDDGPAPGAVEAPAPAPAPVGT
jgi:RND superfamily putative drug exporter